ncbi:MAG: DUF1513 domain-containing protein [Pseudomonadota bacterium]|nr:DUF1513 domain-containing protein [Pseudomonadota bacterium]
MAHTSRRHILASALLATLPAASRAAPHTRRAPLAATWAAANGSHHAGILLLQNNELLAQYGQALEDRNTLELPTRAHALLAAPGGALIVVARRPGDWLLRWRPASAAEPEWVWAEPERAFNGHAIFSADGARLFTTETDLASGTGLIGVRDARTLRLLAEWPTHGIDPHELLLDAGGQLVVANGGVPTQPETGRAKRDLARMDSSLVRLHADTGRLLGQWRLHDARLSLRHLARLPGGPLGIALQAEHDDPAERAAAPVLALFDGQRLRPCHAPQALAGYGGSIAAWGGALWVSCPRVNGVARFDAQGRWQDITPLPEACALAPDASGQHLWIGGRECATRQNGTAPAPQAAPGLRFDNHWIAWPHAAALAG